jgi:hypothetical protein
MDRAFSLASFHIWTLTNDPLRGRDPPAAVAAPPHPQDFLAAVARVPNGQMRTTAARATEPLAVLGIVSIWLAAWLRWRLH